MEAGNYGVVAEPVAPYTDTIDNAIQEQAAFIQEKQKNIESERYTGKPWEVGADPSHVTKSKENSVDEAGGNLAMLERHLFEHWNWVNTYNEWAPFANVVGGAQADLMESAKLMGFDLTEKKDLVQFVEGIEAGLDDAHELVDAKVLGKKGDTSWAGRQRDKGSVQAQGPGLEGEPVAPLLEDLAAGFDEVRGEQLGVYSNLLDARSEALEAQKHAAEGEIGEINGVIAFWTNMASTVESHWPTAKGLASGETGAKVDAAAQNLIDHGRASRDWNSAAKRAQKGEAPGLQRAELERVEMARERITGSESAGMMSPSLSGLVGALLEVGFEDQIVDLQAQITKLEKQLGATEATKKLIKAKDRMDRYVAARKKLRTKAERLKKATLASREQQYADTGDELDRYARDHASELKSEGHGGVVPKNDKSEIYSTLMVMVAKIRAYLTLSEQVRTMFPYDDFVSKAARLRDERSYKEVSPERASAHRTDTGPRRSFRRGRKERTQLGR